MRKPPRHRRPTPLEAQTHLLAAELSRHLYCLPTYLPGHPRPTPAQVHRQARLLARAQLAVGYRTLPAK